MVETTVTLPVALILLLIVFVVAAIMGTNIGRGIFQYLDKYLPGISGSSTPMAEYKIAEYSTDALVCAMNSVIIGNEMSCTGKYKQQQPSLLGGGKGQTISGMVAGEVNYGWLGGGYTGYALADAAQAEEIPAEDRAWVNCTDKVLSSISYYAISEAGKTLQCECRPILTSGFYLSFGFTRDHAYQDCKSKIAENRKFENCKQVAIDDVTEAKEWYSGIVSDVEKVSGKFTRCDCKNSIGEEYAAYGKNQGEAVSACENDVNAPPPSRLMPPVTASATNCREVESDFLLYKKQIPGVSSPMRYDTKQEECTVHNFQLPQYVSNAEDYIIKYGDPKYLVYWNTFPMEESDWTYKVDWATHAAIFAISIIPFGKVASTGVKVGLITANQALKVATKQLLRTELKQAIKKSLENALIKRFSTKKFAKYLVGVGVKAVILESGATILEQIDSFFDKYEPVPGNIVLKSPLSKPAKFKLDDSWSNKPVLVKWKPGAFLESTANFHMVSPCYLDEFKIEKKKVACKEFVNDIDSGSLICSEYSDSQNRIECGDMSDAALNKYFGINDADIISRIKKSSNKELFEYDSNGVLSKISLPYYSAKLGKDVFINNIVFKEKKNTHLERGVSHGEIILSYDYDTETYVGRLHVGSENNRDIIIQCTQINQRGYLYRYSGDDSDSLNTDFSCWIEDNEFGLNLMYPKKDTAITAKTAESCDAKTEECENVIDVIEQAKTPEKLEEGRKLNSERGIFFMQQHRGDIVIKLLDDDGNGRWETLYTDKAIGISINRLYVTMSDIGENGEPNNLKMSYCDTDAIVVDFGRIGSHKSDVEGNNYCLRHKTGTELVIKYAGTVVATGLTLVGIFSGVGTIPTLAIFAAAAAVESGAEIGTDWSSSWPG